MNDIEEPCAPILCLGGLAHGAKHPRRQRFLRIVKRSDPIFHRDREGYPVDISQTMHAATYELRKVFLFGKQLEVYVWERLSEVQFHEALVQQLGPGVFTVLQPGCTVPTDSPDPEFEPACPMPHFSHRRDATLRIGSFGVEIGTPRKNRGGLNQVIWYKRLLQLKLCASFRDELDLWSNRPQPWD